MGFWLILLSLFSPAAAAAGPSFPYLWPLAEPACLTSSFGEYRPGHLHGGIDISTGGEEGRRVLAVADGEVCRVKTRVRGLGKTVYLRLEDGRIAVYGHLSRFMDPVARYVREEQVRRRSYVVDLFPPPGLFLVKQGDVVGLSGQSGAGPPHLHFELREEDLYQVNPLVSGIQVTDISPPIPRFVAVEPLDRRSRVDGGPFPLVLRPRRAEGDSTYVVERPLRCRGRVGLAVAAADRNPQCSGVLAPFELELSLDGYPAFRAALGRTDLRKGAQADGAYGPELEGGGRSEFFRLHLLPGVTLPLYTPELRDGVIHAGRCRAGAREIHFRIRLADVAANESFVEGILLFEEGAGEEEAPVGTAATEWDRDAGRGRLPTLELAHEWGRDFLAVTARTKGPLVAPPEVWLVGAGGGAEASVGPGPSRRDVESIPGGESASSGYRMELTGDGSYLACLAPLPDGEAGRVVVRAWGGGEGYGSEEQAVEGAWFLTRDGGGEIAFPAGAGVIKVPAKALFRDIALRICEIESPPLAAGIIGAGKVFRLEPSGVPFAEKLWIGLRPQAGGAGGDRRPALYRWDEKSSEWSYLGEEADALGGLVGAGVRSLSTVALLVDESPPRIHELRIRRTEGERDQAGGRLSIHARIEEVGSGLEPSGVEMTLDGEWVPAEWDPERGRVVYRAPDPLSSGSHRVELRLSDRAGNSVAATRDFLVP